MAMHAAFTYELCAGLIDKDKSNPEICKEVRTHRLPCGAAPACAHPALGSRSRLRRLCAARANNAIERAMVVLGCGIKFKRRHTHVSVPPAA